MIILLQSVTIQFGRLFSHISYDKLRQSNFIIKCDRLLLQSASGTAKSNRIYYKVRQVLQSVTVITKWDVAEDLFFFFFYSLFYVDIKCSSENLQ